MITAASTYTARSPLHYPGGKSRAVDTIVSYFPTGLKEMVSPFLGGASVELHLAARGIRVHGFDLFEPLADFWQCLPETPQALADAVEIITRFPKKNFSCSSEKASGFLQNWTGQPFFMY